ncbi:MAG: hypothetical protein Q9212_007013 [Teloschistes hypoglaucus]
MSIGPNQVLGAEEVIRGASQLTHRSGHMVDSDGAEKLVTDSEMAAVDPEDQNLPPMDGGPAAWRFIFGAFMMEAFQWGFALNYGVFQNYYFKHQPFQGNKSLSIVGTVATGGFFLGAAVVIPFIKFFPRCRRPMVWIGWALSVVSLIAASFATTLGVLIATQGVIYTVGITILYWPVMSMMSEWFVKKRGLAFGIFTAATGLSGIVMPFALAALLDRYGYATTLRAMGVALAVFTGPVLPMVKGRIPAWYAGANKKKADLSFLKNPVFYFFSASVLFQGLGHYFPTLYLPLYATLLGHSSLMGALLLALFSVAQIIGQVGIGHLSDGRVSVQMLAFIIPSVSCIAVFTLWGFGRSLACLIPFSLIYGVFAGGYLILWARMGMTFGDDEDVALTTFGIFAFLKGIGNIITGPIGAALVAEDFDTKAYGLESYTGTLLHANVAYDTFLSTTPTGSQTHEIMIWLGVFGDIYPLSDNGYPPFPVATPTIGGVAFNLIAGHNGNVIVYSFVTAPAVTSFRGDLMGFYKFLEGSFGLSSGLYLQTVQAGTEVFTGTGARLTTSGYSIGVN